MFHGIRFWVAVFFLFMLTANNSAFSQSRAPSRGAQKPVSAAFMAETESYEESQRITKAVFKNGLTVLVYELHAHPLVSIQTYIFSGNLDDAGETVGLSDITARARENVVEGSLVGEINRRIKALGGVLQSRADSGHLRFEITVPPARWKQALNVQAEVLLKPFENNGALRQSTARLAENTRDEFAPHDIVAEKELRALAFGEHRFASSGYLLEIEPEKIIEFHKNGFVPSATTLVIAGDVRAGDALNEIVRVFDSNSAETTLAVARNKENVKNEKTDAAIPSRAGLRPAGEFRYRATTRNIAFPKVLFGFPVSSKNSEDYRTLEVAAAILGIGETSVLNTRLRDRKNLVFTARTEMKYFVDTGFFSVELETESQNVDSAEIAFWTEVEILKKDGPSKAELARAIAQLERLWWKRRETVGGLADALAESEFQGDWKRMEGYITEIRKVTAVEVKQAITRHLTLSNCALLEYLPHSLTDRNLTAATARRIFESLLQPAVKEELVARTGEIEPNLKIPPAGAAFRLSEVRYSFQTASILRGPEIYIREDHTSPLIEMGFWFTGGKASEGKTNAGVTGFMLEMMLRNERENCQLEIYGGRLTPMVAEDYFGFLLSIPSRNISGGLERIKQVMKSPVFDEAEIEKLKKIAVARAQSSKMQNVEKRLLKEALFRDHPYAYELSAMPESLKNISLKTVRDWYEENVRNVKPFVVIIGDTEGTSLASWFVSEFSGSRMKERKNAVPSPNPVEKKENLKYNGDVGRPAILIGFQAPSMGDTDIYGTLTLKNYLENHLWETGVNAGKIQGFQLADRHLSCEYQPLLAGGSFIISIEIKAGDEARGIESLREVVTRLISQPLSNTDFHAARALTAGSYIIENQVRKTQMENLMKNLLASRSLEEYQNFSWNIEQVEENDLKELMRRNLDMNKTVILVVNGGDR